MVAGNYPEKYSDFIRCCIGKVDNIKKLAGDASSRSYYRVIKESRSFILCHDNAFENLPEKDYPYLIIHELFQSCNIPVPEIYETDSAAGLLLIQDLGDMLLQEKAAQISKSLKHDAYKIIIDILLKIQSICGDSRIPFNLSFDSEKLMQEFEFFINHTLSGFMGIEILGPLKSELVKEFNKISHLLDRPEHFVLNHRDFHSRNILYFRNVYFIIDFQDARMGLPLYDLVSLLRDSYTLLDDATLSVMINYYYEKGRSDGIHDMTQDEFNFYFDLSAFQRNVKAIGSFGYHAHVNNKILYADFISPTLKYLDGYAGRRSELRNAVRLLREIIPDDYLGA